MTAFFPTPAGDLPLVCHGSAVTFPAPSSFALLFAPTQKRASLACLIACFIACLFACLCVANLLRVRLACCVCFACLFVCLFVRLFVCLFVCLDVCLDVCVCGWVGVLCVFCVCDVRLLVYSFFAGFLLVVGCWLLPLLLLALCFVPCALCLVFWVDL